MDVSSRDVRQALAELGKLRFGEMRVEDALHEIVQTTHTIFDVDGAGLMLADAEHHLRNVAYPTSGSGIWKTCRYATRKAPASLRSTIKSSSGSRTSPRTRDGPPSARLQWPTG